MPVIGFIAAILISVISLIFPDYVPEMLVNNQFTLTALLLNIGGGCLLLTAGVKLLFTHRQSNKPEDLVFCLQCVLLGVGAIMFQYSAPWDLQWWNWHALRLFGYCIALWLVANATRRFEARLFSLNETLEQRVCERTDEYERANHSLQETIDQLERTRNELVQAEKLAALGALVAGVAHELNTPLGNAKLAVSTLSEDLMTVTANYQEGKLSRSQIVQYLKNGKEIINLACRAVDRAVDLVASFKQVAVDQTSERRRSFDLAAVIEETVAALRPSYKCRPWQFIIDVPDGIEMDSYPGPLGQIVINMVLNSINHGFDGREQGNVTITGRRDAIIPGQIILIFHDDGAGIAPENLDRVFDPFFTTRLGFGGSGIGLNVTYRIATSVLGGSIAVESAPGFGATFKLTIPQTAPVQI